MITTMSNPNANAPHVAVQARTAPLPLQPASADIWARKYCLRDAQGAALDADPDATLQRVARALADVERSDALRESWYPRFLTALRNGALPAGRIIANAGAGGHKPATSTVNCTVSGSIEDSMDSILGRLHEAGMTLKAGCGVGYEFSTLRPRGARVAGAGAHTSGPLSFMDVYDSMCATVSSAGGRRGAQMATFDVRHPDVLEFVRAKREPGRLRHFNLSLLIDDRFMEAVRDDADWQLIFPVHAATPGENADDIVWREWPHGEGQIVDDEGLVACRVHETLPARRLWDAIMASAYDYGEPGCLFIDRVGEENNAWWCESIRATNPCGEQPLPPYGACLLGSINLTRFVTDAFGERAAFDWQAFRETVAVFTRMLDNAVEINGLPLAQQRAEIVDKRRHGMGFLGLGSALALLGIRYGSPQSLQFTAEVSRELALTGWRTGLELAREKGPAPILERAFTVTPAMLRRRPELAEAGYETGDEVPGRVLHARFSRYMQRLAEIDPQLVEALAETGARFTHHSSIAPTGTIALSLANNASNGIEPSFAHRYARNVVRDGRSTREKVDVCSYEYLAYRHALGEEPDAGSEPALPDWFVTADDVAPGEHLDVQAAAQRFVDSSISKTINVPTDMPFERFKDIYFHAWEKGLKGCTVFRFNPGNFQGVLVRPQDLARTHYEFVLDDGSRVRVRGDEEVDYAGETHTAANLYDALKEGYLAGG